MSISVDINNINIDNSWKEVLKDDFLKDYFLKIKEFLLQEKTN
jgi:uracil DNA glycosylase